MTSRWEPAEREIERDRKRQLPGQEPAEVLQLGSGARGGFVVVARYACVCLSSCLPVPVCVSLRLRCLWVVYSGGVGQLRVYTTK